MKRLFLSVMVLMCAAMVSAQDKVEADLSADIVNQYIWRGQDLGHVSIQPSLELGYKGLSLAAWGNVGLSDPADTKELDLTASYTVGGFSIGVTDYWTDESDGRYFLYDADRTAHVFEAFAGYDFGVVSVNWYTNFAGNDGVGKSGDRAYSSYLEVAAPFQLGGLDWTGTLGIVPYATTTYATDGFAVVAASVRASKEVSITENFKLPLFAEIATNPCDQKAYFVFGLTLKAF
ncbi:MAG: hypothetical protein J6Y23_11480 [Prevotella sp.]|nr:hypothetical protein [Prevotella sp.]